METLMDETRRPGLVEQIQRESNMELGRIVETASIAASPAKSSIPPASSIPRPPSWGPRVVRSLPLDAVFQWLFKNELFRLSLGAKNTLGEAWEKLQTQYEEMLDAMRREALRDPWLQPQAVSTVSTVPWKRGFTSIATALSSLTIKSIPRVPRQPLAAAMRSAIAVISPHRG